MNAKQIGRNDTCPCGSGNKYKRCCATKDAATRSAELLAEAAARAAQIATEAEAAEGTEEPVEVKAQPKPRRPKLPTSHGTNRGRNG